MPTTRKKTIKTVYKDENSDEEKGGDFSDSGSDAKISEPSSSEEDQIESEHSSADEFDEKPKNLKRNRKQPVKKPKLTKKLIEKINKQTTGGDESLNENHFPAIFSIKDLTEADKLLPSILNLSESDSSDDESPRISKNNTISLQHTEQQADSDNEVVTEYKDVFSNNIQIQDDSEEIAKKTFMELEQHKSKVEKTKATLQNYTLKLKERESDVKDLLALGEEALPSPKMGAISKKPKFRKHKDNSDSEMEDWEEVKDTKTIPQQGIQLFVEFPDAGYKKKKKIDVEMMMKRKINRVKKEYQVYMHKVHVLCWLGHGNYISRILNDQEVMAAALSLVPSKECYPGERVDMKYLEQITTWYKDKLTLKQDKNEDKFKPKAPALKIILLDQIKKRVVTAKKYLAYIFVCMLRALGLQCRVIFNFVTLPLKPPTSELCSLSTKSNDQKTNQETKLKTPKLVNSKTKSSTNSPKAEPKASTSKDNPKNLKVPQLDGNIDECFENENVHVHWSDRYHTTEVIMQVDGNDDVSTSKKTKPVKRPKTDVLDVSPPKIQKKSGHSSPKPNASPSKIKDIDVNNEDQFSKKDTKKKCDPINSCQRFSNAKTPDKDPTNNPTCNNINKAPNASRTSNRTTKSRAQNNTKAVTSAKNDKLKIPNITVSDENRKEVASEYFENPKADDKVKRLSRKRALTTNPTSSKSNSKVEEKETVTKAKGRTKSAPGSAFEKSKYFESSKSRQNTPKRPARKAKEEKSEDQERVSHRDLAKSNNKGKTDVTGDLVDIIKTRIKESKLITKKGIGKISHDSGEDSDYLPVEDIKRRKSGSDDDFKPTKISPKPSTSRRIDRRVLSTSTDEGAVKKNKVDIWCEIFVEELEQWISVDVVKGKIHSTKDFYANATHPVCYVVGWDNNNYLKDLTRKYVPHFNTETRKLRVDPPWWDTAVSPYLGPKTARDREEDEYLSRMQLEAPLPKSIAEYKNHPLYALKRHLLKFEAIYPPDAASLGFVRGEPVYARECVYTCRSRDTWLKEAKVVKLGENAYKVVKARPKWDKLSNKLITDKPLEVFGPWQVQDYEPPVAENGVVPRNAYGNVELFKECMLPKGTVHIKLPGLNRVAKKLNIDCAPAMTGFDFNGGWSHPVYDGFVVCEEFETIVTEAWVKDQEELERKEREKVELRVYGNWKRLIKGLLIRERLKNKYGFEKPTTSVKGKSKGPKLVVKKKS
ncbi:unnamed protein product [Arctia plantaginis]|uniref:Uncharacterized protein n=1 Tax=Arctia plantaginis TaxID=874455 RepID=A0A8S0ZPC2_ARCPL|nr:unnamed protein product [Arctia plantaginis]CAB3236203.1 unnamed protein product [Arctia plantaginis]